MVEELSSSIKQCTVSLVLKLLNQIMFSSIIKVAPFFLLVKCRWLNGFLNLNNNVLPYNELNGHADNYLSFSEVYSLPEVFQVARFY